MTRQIHDDHRIAQRETLTNQMAVQAGVIIIAMKQKRRTCARLGQLKVLRNQGVITTGNRADSMAVVTSEAVSVNPVVAAIGSQRRSLLGLKPSQIDGCQLFPERLDICR